MPVINKDFTLKATCTLALAVLMSLPATAKVIVDKDREISELKDQAAQHEKYDAALKQNREIILAENLTVMRDLINIPIESSSFALNNVYTTTIHTNENGQKSISVKEILKWL